MSDGMDQKLANRISDGLHLLAERVRKDPSQRLVCRLELGDLVVTVKGIAMVTPREETP